jgi:hypothetical protein
VANAALRVIGMATQAHGDGRVPQEFPLAIMWASVDGPDEVHLQQLGTNENKKARICWTRWSARCRLSRRCLRGMGTKLAGPLCLGRESGDKAKL